jgi:hypothetical protein
MAEPKQNQCRPGLIIHTQRTRQPAADISRVHLFYCSFYGGLTCNFQGKWPVNQSNALICSEHQTGSCAPLSQISMLCVRAAAGSMLYTVMVARNYWAPLNEVCASLSKCFYLLLFAISVLLWVLGEKCQFMALPTQRDTRLPFEKLTALCSLMCVAVQFSVL